jgi:effector-binding domain-containing protein
MPERRVRLTHLPEMRLAYLEHRGPMNGIAALWEQFNGWRLAERPALGRIEISQIGWLMNPDAEDAEHVEYRAAIPVRSDYEATGDARTTFFPGGTIAYAYADDLYEIEEALSTVSDWVEAEGGWRIKAVLELYHYHYNLDQHPLDCALLLERE